MNEANPNSTASATSAFGRRRFLRTTAATGLASVAGLGAVGTGGAQATGGQEAGAGERRWSVDLPLDVLSSPTVVDGAAYVGHWYAGDDGNAGRLVALDAGVDGSSDGSRVTLGTLGHDDGYRYADQSIDVDRPTATATESSSETASPSETATTAPGTTGAGQGQTDAAGPGFGVATVIAGLGGTASLRARGGGRDESDPR